MFQNSNGTVSSSNFKSCSKSKTTENEVQVFYSLCRSCGLMPFEHKPTYPQELFLHLEKIVSRALQSERHFYRQSADDKFANFEDVSFVQKNYRNFNGIWSSLSRPRLPDSVNARHYILDNILGIITRRI
jgi:hypothetical protein